MYKTWRVVFTVRTNNGRREDEIIIPRALGRTKIEAVCDALGDVKLLSMFTSYYCKIVDTEVMEI